MMKRTYNIASSKESFVYDWRVRAKDCKNMVLKSCTPWEEENKRLEQLANSRYTIRFMKLIRCFYYAINNYYLSLFSSFSDKAMIPYCDSFPITSTTMNNRLKISDAKYHKKD